MALLERMDAGKAYRFWLNHPQLDEVSRQELKSISGQHDEIEDRFYKDLEFGTGGLRGVIGVGTNRINQYTVARASQGLAQYIINKHDRERHSVVIACDSRHMSQEFALETALVMAANGIKAYVFESLRPTPELSFAVRELSASGGVVITASHNPPEYNGYKVYGTDGGQLVPEAAEQVIDQISKLSIFDHVRRMEREEAEDRGLLQWIGADLDERYIQAVKEASPRYPLDRDVAAALRVIYTPLHGSGNHPVRAVLQQSGFHVTVVREQELPDAQFSTVKSPNPEEREAFAMALELAKQDDVDLIIGTDPDCDRMGAIVRHPGSDGSYHILNGNQTGAILTHYVLDGLRDRQNLPTNGVVIKTIVTSELGAKIARHYGMSTMDTLTGFKYIAEKMTEFEQTGMHQFLFGYEESYGYLAGTYCRDKDAVLASLLMAEAAAYYKQQGKTLIDVLEQLYTEHGYFLEHLQSITLQGKQGLEQIQHTMEEWRNHPPRTIGEFVVEAVEDYINGWNGLRPENVLKYKLSDGSWFCLRPSGTEPKLKVYFGVCGVTKEQAEGQISRIVTEVMSRMR